MSPRKMPRGARRKPTWILLAALHSPGHCGELFEQFRIAGFRRGDQSIVERPSEPIGIQLMLAGEVACEPRH
jgi:hypothetical protein